MAYRIEYDNSTNKYEVINVNSFRFPVILLICFLIFLFLTSFFWPEGKALIEEVMIPGENAVTIVALNTMAEELREGTSFSDAVYTFCCEIIDGAENTD